MTATPPPTVPPGGPVSPRQPADDVTDVAVTDPEEIRRAQDETDVIDLLTEEHRGVEALLVDLTGGAGSVEHRRDLADVMIAELSRHATAEERFLYPVVREALPGGGRTVDREIDEYGKIERTAQQLGRLDATEGAFGRWCTELALQVSQHIDSHERHLFPLLRQACDPDRLRELGHRVRAAKELAPTRPHPHAPHAGPWSIVLGVADKIMDEVTGRPTELHDLAAGPPEDGPAR
jgi:hypothetical protein